MVFRRTYGKGLGRILLEKVITLTLRYGIQKRIVRPYNSDKINSEFFD